jgi:ATP-dependent RNA helicase
MSVERKLEPNPITQEEETNDSLEEIHAWDNLEISSELLRGIYAMGFEKPSPIQRKAIKPLIDGKDIIAQAQSGTGKTATFTIGALSHVKVEENTTQILILSPTRELSIQTASVATLLGSVMNGLRVKTLIGGSSIDEDARVLKNNPPHVITGCPGRVFDMMRRNHIDSNSIKMVILDEADEMLSTGFKDQIYNIKFKK